MKPHATPLSRVTGIALIVLPLIAWGFKLMSFGWMIVFVLFGPIVILLVGYVLQIIIASQGFLSKNGIFGPAMKRATIAAWATSVGIVLLGIFMPDGGDAGYGSTLQVWLGSYGENAQAVHSATDTLTEVLAIISGLVWVAGFGWLFLEWLIALVRRKQARAGQAVPTPAR